LWGKQAHFFERTKASTEKNRGGLCVYFTHKLKHTSAMNPLENFAFDYISVNTKNTAKEYNFYNGLNENGIRPIWLTVPGITHP